MTEPPRARARTSRRRRRLRLVALVVVVVVITIAAVWVAASRAVVPGVSAQLYPLHYEESIARVAEQNDLDPYLVAAVARTESGWDPEAVSHAGAVGLMQLMPDTAGWITGLESWQHGDDPDLTDPEESLELGAFYLAYLVKYFGGDTRLALAAYNAGQGAVTGWLKDGDTRESIEITDIPIDETREFVERVEYYRDLYARVHPGAFAAEGGSK
jgi:soluble lytic murein transglycosylase